MDDRISCIRKACDLQIHCVISFMGRLDELRLSRAVRLSLDAEPVLGCRLIKKGGRQYWQRRKDLDSLELVTVVKTAQPEKNIHEYLISPLDLEKDPLVQVNLIRGDTDTLCIKVNHIVADGGGVYEYAALLAEIYRKLGVNSNFKPVINSSGERSISQVTNKFSKLRRFRHFLQLFKSYIGELFPRKNWSVNFSTIADLNHRSFYLRKFDENIFQNIVQYAKRNNYTVNDVLLAAFYRTFFHLYSPTHGTPLRVGVTINLRRFLPNGRGDSICNLAAMFLLNIGSEIGANFSETIEKVSTAMEKYKKGDLGMGDKRYALFRLRILPFSLTRKIYRYHQIFKFIIGPKSVPPIFSNAGVLNSEHFDFGIEITDAYLVPPVAFPPGFFISFTSFRNTLTMGTGFCESALNRANVESMFDYCESELMSLK